MHSYIYQVRTAPLSENDILDSDNIKEGESVFLDYTYDIEESERETAIKKLVEQTLPKGMFSLNPDMTLTYNGGFPMWKKSYFDSVMKVTMSITPANVMDEYGTMRVLKRSFLNPFNTANLFECGETTAEKSIELMRVVANLSKGDKLYFGAVIGYHS